MKDKALKEALRQVPLPVAPETEERGQRVVEAAYAERETPRRDALDSRRPLPRLALALGIATLLAALLLSPAGAAVRDWVGDVVDSAPKPEPELSRIPGGGRLLVQSAVGPWVVQPDGSRRLLGDYEEATWSPRGLFIVAAEGRTLTALEPGGTPHWSLTAAARVSDPRWAPGRGERIAYRSGDELRIVAGDGTGDRLLAPSTAPVAAAWSPWGDAGLAYVSGSGQLSLVNSETGEDLAQAPALPGISRLDWGADGSAILESSPRELRLREVQARKVAPGPALGAVRTLALPGRGISLTGAALAPTRETAAAVVTHWRDHGTTSEVLLFPPGAAKPRSLLTVPGSLGEVAWSPDGRRLLVAWPGANQWLFLPVGAGKPRAVAEISTAFAPGGRPLSFPRVEGWCCR